jgi:PBP1b-binding outer membrane lipoprotein LpoB
MKKVTLILAVVFSTFLLTSCTDESNELEELNNEKMEVFAVDKTKIKRPGSQGS